ncbi:hypothetical protein RF11_00186 [Thelohanellus kitauei]|uniref:Uncharacterized protein n=1 Tax=Thelohanellus kitauei TaxID=669202 RepID=A0A0C2MSY3_THEKT|nr:hypothetical protein RF11_00186 [Thelohanellus kitauei]
MTVLLLGLRHLFPADAFRPQRTIRVVLIVMFYLNWADLKHENEYTEACQSSNQVNLLKSNNTDNSCKTSKRMNEVDIEKKPRIHKNFLLGLTTKGAYHNYFRTYIRVSESIIGEQTWCEGHDLSHLKQNPSSLLAPLGRSVSLVTLSVLARLLYPFCMYFGLSLLHESQIAEMAGSPTISRCEKFQLTSTIVNKDQNSEYNDGKLIINIPKLTDIWRGLKVLSALRGIVSNNSSTEKTIKLATYYFT